MEYPYHVARDSQERDLSITPATIISSLSEGQPTIGVYSTSRDNKCKWIVLDFDTETSASSIVRMRRVVIEAYKRALSYGAKPFLEFSGNKGYHLWILTEPMSSEIAFKAASVLGHNILGEIFPRQPVLTASKKYGNLVRLPCNVNLKSGSPSTWLSTSFSAYDDQLGYFDRLERTSLSVIEAIAEDFEGPEDLLVPSTLEIRQNFKVDITHTLYKIGDGRGRHAAQFPLVMKCLEAGMTDDEIMELGENWLRLYQGAFSSSLDYALFDLKKCLDYCRSSYKPKDS